MARWHYPRSRRIMMQAVMCLIFVGSVGLAGLVTRERRSERASQLGGMLHLRGVGVRLPAGWSLEREGHGVVLFVVKEPDSDDRQGRTLIIRRDKVDPTLTPEAYLDKSGLLSDTQPYNLSDDQNADAPQAITIDKMQGVLFAVQRQVNLIPFGSPVLKPEWIACSVRHSGVAITLQLQCPDGLHADDDRQLIRDTAAAIEVSD